MQIWREVRKIRIFILERISTVILITNMHWLENLKYVIQKAQESAAANTQAVDETDGSEAASQAMATTADPQDGDTKITLEMASIGTGSLMPQTMSGQRLSFQL